MGKPKPKNAMGQKYFGLITVDAKPPIKARTVTKNRIKNMLEINLRKFSFDCFDEIKIPSLPC